MITEAFFFLTIKAVEMKKLTVKLREVKKTWRRGYLEWSSKFIQFHWNSTTAYVSGWRGVRAFRRCRPARRRLRRTSRGPAASGGARPATSTSQAPPPALESCAAPAPAFRPIQLFQSFRSRLPTLPKWWAHFLTLFYSTSPLYQMEVTRSNSIRWSCFRFEKSKLNG